VQTLRLAALRAEQREHAHASYFFDGLRNMSQPENDRLTNNRSTSKFPVGIKAFAMEISQWRNGDRRECPRVRMQLKVAVVYHQHKGRSTPPTYHGRTYDICMSGLSLVIDRSIFHEGEVTVLLALPQALAGAPQKIMTATAEMTYAIRSSKLKAFKIGMAFLEFKGNGKELLEAAIERELKKAGVIGTESPGSRSRAGRPRDSQPPS